MGCIGANKWKLNLNEIEIQCGFPDSRSCKEQECSLSFLHGCSIGIFTENTWLMYYMAHVLQRIWLNMGSPVPIKQDLTQPEIYRGSRRAQPVFGQKLKVLFQDFWRPFCGPQKLHRPQNSSRLIQSSGDLEIHVICFHAESIGIHNGSWNGIPMDNKSRLVVQHDFDTCCFCFCYYPLRAPCKI